MTERRTTTIMRAGLSAAALAAIIVLLSALFLILGETLTMIVHADACPTLAVQAPKVKGVTDLVTVCHDGAQGYEALVDPGLKIPRVVTYMLTKKKALGCVARSTCVFKQDPAADETVKPADYAGSGYDLGHMMPFDDGNLTPTSAKDSCLLSNIAPQLPGLNRQEWERLEETTRAWAVERGTLQVFTGPIMDKNPKTIGQDHIAVPIAFFKVIYDPGAKQVLSFIMPQKAIAKGDVEPWRVPLHLVESQAGLSFWLPKTLSVGKVWPVDLGEYHKARSAACGGK